MLDLPTNDDETCTLFALLLLILAEYVQVLAFRQGRIVKFDGLDTISRLVNLIIGALLLGRVGKLLIAS